MSCSCGKVAKHFHPAAGTLVYVLDGESQSKSSGKWKLIKMVIWFEKSDWVHVENQMHQILEKCVQISW